MQHRHKNNMDSVEVVVTRESALRRYHEKKARDAKVEGGPYAILIVYDRKYPQIRITSPYHDPEFSLKVKQDIELYERVSQRVDWASHADWGFEMKVLSKEELKKYKKSQLPEKYESNIFDETLNPRPGKEFHPGLGFTLVQEEGESENMEVRYDLQTFAERLYEKCKQFGIPCYREWDSVSHAAIVWKINNSEGDEKMLFGFAEFLKNDLSKQSVKRYDNYKVIKARMPQHPISRSDIYKNGKFRSDIYKLCRYLNLRTDGMISVTEMSSCFLRYSVESLVEVANTKKGLEKAALLVDAANSAADSGLFAKAKELYEEAVKFADQEKPPLYGMRQHGYRNSYEDFISQCDKYGTCIFAGERRGDDEIKPLSAFSLPMFKGGIPKEHKDAVIEFSSL